VRAHQTTGGGLKTRNTLLLCTYNLASAVYIKFQTDGQVTHTNSRTDQTPISTATSPQQENEQIWTTNPQHKQGLQTQWDDIHKKKTYIYTVEPRSIVPVSIVFPHLPFAIFGPE